MWLPCKRSGRTHGDDGGCGWRESILAVPHEEEGICDVVRRRRTEMQRGCIEKKRVCASERSEGCGVRPKWGSSVVAVQRRLLIIARL